MSTEINDEDAVHLMVAQAPLDLLDKFRSCATSSTWTDDDGNSQLASQMLYPFYGGQHVPDKVVHDFYHVFSVSIPQNAAQMGVGQSVVILINATSSTIKVTRAYRDGGYMIGIPYFTGTVDGAAVTDKPNIIPGLQDVGGVKTFGVGGYINNYASIFYGSGGVLQLNAQDSAFSPAGVSYGSSINGGSGLGVSANLAGVSDLEAWYDKTGDQSDFKGGSHVTDTHDRLKITASFGSWNRLESGQGGLFSVLLENV